MTTTVLFEIILYPFCAIFDKSDFSTAGPREYMFSHVVEIDRNFKVFLIA